LKSQAKELRDGIINSNPYMMSDTELTPMLDRAEQIAKDTGVWKADQGADADIRINYKKEKLLAFSYTEEEAAAQALKNIHRYGYVDRLRDDRRMKEEKFTLPTKEFLTEHEPDETESQRVEKLRQRTYELSTLDHEGESKIAADFHTGNFLYHGTGTSSIIEILESGAIANANAIREREKAAAALEGRDAKLIKNNSGYEGISWSMNEIDALPGDRFHLAGFLAAPETALGESDQLVIPSRPAPNEVLEVPAGIDANKFYTAKTQLELYRQPGLFSETNSLLGNVLALKFWHSPDRTKYNEEPLLEIAKRGILAEPDYKDRLRSLYTLGKEGEIQLSPDLLQQVGNELPVAAVWIQAAIDNGRFKDTEFDGKDLVGVIDSVDDDNFAKLVGLSRPDWTPSDKYLDEQEEHMSSVEVSVEDMYFVAPKKDVETWIQVIARSGRMPKGILLYDDKKIRLENFASVHRGDHSSLTAELQKAINPNNPAHIDYSDVLGTSFTDDMRAGHRHQVIAEKHLSNRGSIIKQDSSLVIIR
jgi:hypothetical protein